MEEDNKTISRVGRKHNSFTMDDADKRFADRQNGCLCSLDFLHGSRRWAVVLFLLLVFLFYLILITDKLISDGPLSVFEHMTNLAWILELICFGLLFFTQLGRAITEMAVPRNHRVALGRAIHYIPQSEGSEELLRATRKCSWCAPPPLLGSSLIVYYPWYSHARANSDLVILFFLWPIFTVALVVNFVVLAIFYDNPSLLLHLTTECSTGTISAGTVILGNWIYHYFPPFVFLLTFVGLLSDIKAAFVSAAYLYSPLLYGFFVAWNVLLGCIVPFILYIVAVNYQTVYNTDVSVGVALLAGAVALTLSAIAFWWLNSAALFDADLAHHGRSGNLELEVAEKELKQFVAPTGTYTESERHARLRSVMG